MSESTVYHYQDRTYLLKPMALEELSRVKSFLARNFSSESHQNHEAWVQWQLDNPNGHYIQLCLHDDEIAALSFFLPTTLAYQNNHYTAAFSTITMVSPQHRRRGLGGAIHDARLQAFDWALSSGQSKENYNLYMKKKFHRLGEYYYGLVVKKFPRPFMNRAYLHQLFSWMKYYTVSALTQPVNSTLHISTTLPADIPSSFFTNRMPPTTICPIHSRTYLNWRYVRHPYLTYQFANVLVQNQWLGLAVIRYENRTLHIVDIYGQYEAMAAVTACLLKKLPAEAVYGLFVGSTLRRILNQCGCYTHPHGSYYLGNSKNPHLTPLLNHRDWCLFGGDSDKDR